MPTLDFRVVKATSAHLSQLANIELAAATRFVGWDVPASAFTEASPLKSLLVGQRCGLLWVAADGARVIGFAMASDVGEQLILEEIDVLPECSSQGVGSELIEAVMREAGDRGCSHVYLSTYRDVPWNAPWYLRRRFEFADDDDSLGQALLSHDEERGFATMPRVALRRVIAV
jgi:GNAT superfamily N-acetyltransferase